VSWVQHHLGTDTRLWRIAYGNGQFVAVGDSGTSDSDAIMNSVDGMNWIERQSGMEGFLYGIAYGNGKFVAVGTGGTILQSGSIINLSITPNAGTGLLTLSLEGPTGLDYSIQSSTNLTSWQTLTNVTSLQPTVVIFDAMPAAAERAFYRAYSQ
jgi:hypothetical protein